MAYQLRGKYFEDLELGAEFQTPGRTVTESDVVAFAGFSGDYQPLHTDAEFAKQSFFGERIAHGLVSLSIVTGLMYCIGLIEGTGEAFLSIDWQFKRPVKFGDTIAATFTVAEKRRTSKGTNGVVKFGVALTNQCGELVSGGTFAMLVTARDRQPE